MLFTIYQYYCEQSTDDRTKLQASAIINDCHKYIMDLNTNGVVITDAIKYVQGKMDHLNIEEKKLLQDIKNKGMEDTKAEAAEAEDKGLSNNSEGEGEQATHNGIF